MGIGVLVVAGISSLSSVSERSKLTSKYRLYFKVVGAVANASPGLIEGVTDALEALIVVVAMAVVDAFVEVVVVVVMVV